MNKKERILIGQKITELIAVNGGITKVAEGADVTRKLIGVIQRGGNYQIKTLNRLAAYLKHEIYLRKML